MNTAISFATNTNWQAYSGESTLSYLTQMLGLGVQNFLSAATGIAVLIALIRGFTRRTSQAIGNFWVDLTRSTLYILLPLSFVLSLALVWQGVPQNFSEYKSVPLVEATTATETAKDADGNRQRCCRQGRHQEQTRHRTILPLGPGRFADRDQATRHQRRRLLRRQLGAIRTRTRRRSAIFSKCWRSC